VRSPAEYAEDHIPGAISAPVLDDAERAEVGTLYKQVSAFDAKKLGAALLAKNVARHVDSLFRDKDKSWRPLVYCWRGGKRSGAMAHILREIGWRAETIEGGYKAYRRWVVGELETIPEKFAFRVVHGPTGSGKSRLLGALQGAGAQVLDLEALAAHRGSVLGNLPDRPQPSQKMFESLLIDALSALKPSAPVFVEGESKKDRPAPGARGADRAHARVAMHPARGRPGNARRPAARGVPPLPARPRDAGEAARLPGRVARPRAHRRVEGARRARRVARVRHAAAGRALRSGLSPLVAPELRAAGRRGEAVDRRCG
jgi:rhodanese-related sulfurtransferase